MPFVLEYSYDNSGNLIQASYPDGECVRYDYTRTGRLSQIHTVDEKQFAISYDGKRVKQIEQIADVGTQAASENAHRDESGFKGENPLHSDIRADK